MWTVDFLAPFPSPRDSEHLCCGVTSAHIGVGCCRPSPLLHHLPQHRYYSVFVPTYQCPRAAVTQVAVEWLKPTGIYSLQLRRPEIQSQCVGKALPSPKAPGEAPLVSVSSCGGWPSSAFLGWWRRLCPSSRCILLSLCACPCVSSPLLLRSPAVLDSGHTLRKCDFVLTSYICKDLTSREGHIHRSRRLRLEHNILENTIQVTTPGCYAKF